MAKKLALAKGEAGIARPEPAPTLREFANEFLAPVRMDCASKPRTIAFYEEKMRYPLRETRLADARGWTGVVFRNERGETFRHTWLDQQHAETRELLGFPTDFVLQSLATRLVRD